VHPRLRPNLRLAVPRRDEAIGRAVEPEDLELDPFSRWGGLGRAQQAFGDRFLPLLSELNEVLAA